MIMVKFSKEAVSLRLDQLVVCAIQGRRAWGKAYLRCSAVKVSRNYGVEKLPS